MQEFVKRMLKEKEDLEGKVNRLEKFVNDDGPQSRFKSLSEKEQDLDKKQLSFMKGYLGCLEERIRMHEGE